jgi:CMP-N-acetylneuraminic acid synthetase
MKNLCTLCMRGGSKGVPNKNLRELCGKPLMAYSIDQALESGLFEHVVVSTDSAEIAETARSLGAEAWFLRPAELATDEAPKLPVIRHAFTESEKHYGRQFDVLVDLDATSPLRSVEDITRAYAQFIEGSADILITASPARKNPYFNMVEVVNGSVDVVKRSGLEKMLVSEKASIRDALNALSKSGEKCLMVVGPNRNLLGTLSDGDVRKAILQGITIDQVITEAYNRKPTYLVRESYKADDVEKIFLENKFDMIPIVDKDGVVTGYIVWEDFFIDKGKISNPLQNANLTIPVRRQDAPHVYEMNASIYIWKREALLGNDTLFTDRTTLYVMPEVRSVDIDTELDWKFVELILTKGLNRE